MIFFSKEQFFFVSIDITFLSLVLLSQLNCVNKGEDLLKGDINYVKLCAIAHLCLWFVTVSTNVAAKCSSYIFGIISIVDWINASTSSKCLSIRCARLFQFPLFTCDTTSVRLWQAQHKQTRQFDDRAHSSNLELSTLAHINNTTERNIDLSLSFLLSDSVIVARGNFL